MFRSCHSRSLRGSLQRRAIFANGLVARAWLALGLTVLGCRHDGGAIGPLSPTEPAPALVHASSAPPVAASSSTREAAPVGPRQELASLSRGSLWAAWNSLRGDAYALDEVERSIETRVSCHPEGLVTHRGQLLSYQGAVQVDPAFVERLVRFEQLVIDVARDIYGRAPSRLRHFGAYNCRSMRQRTARISEHALGNAIDVLGFDFASAKRAEPLAPGLPNALSRPFEVRVSRHWSPRDGGAAAAVHTRFLRELAARLGDRSDVFRGMIGPSRRDHADHFHFDMSPWRFVWF